MLAAFKDPTFDKEPVSVNCPFNRGSALFELTVAAGPGDRAAGTNYHNRRDSGEQSRSEHTKWLLGNVYKLPM
jgi:hypothetical protein